MIELPKRTLNGRVERVLVAPGDDGFLSEAREEVEVTFAGFVGDRHYGLTRAATYRYPYPAETQVRNSRQVSILSREELDEITAAMSLPEIQPEWLGANLVLTGIPKLTLLPPSTSLFFAREATLIVTGENLPCAGPGRVLQRRFPDQADLDKAFPKAALNRRGLVAWVERPGVIRGGDEVRVAIPRQILYDF